MCIRHPVCYRSGRVISAEVCILNADEAGRLLAVEVGDLVHCAAEFGIGHRHRRDVRHQEYHGFIGAFP